jgi:hypothetical protein
MRPLACAIAFLFLMHGLALALGRVNLKGHLLKLSEKTVDVEVNEWLYVVDRKQIGADDLKKIAALKPQAPVDFWVSFDAIVDAHKLQATPSEPSP